MSPDRNSTQARFAEIALKIRSGETVSAAEKRELKQVASWLGVAGEEKRNGSGETTTCYWICDNGFSCNPSSPPPNCNCHQICF